MTLFRLFTISPLLLGLCAGAHASKVPFTGFSMIAGVGGIIAEADMSQAGTSENVFVFPANYTNHQPAFQGNVAGMLGIGYGYQFQQGLVLGGVITAGLNYVTLTNTASVTGGNLPLPQTLLFEGKLETQLKNDYALLFKPGFAFGHALVYGLIGARWGNFDTSFSSSTENYDSFLYVIDEDEDEQSRYQLGVAAGAGISYALLKHLIAGVEYQYTAYNGDLGSFDTAGRYTADGGLEFAAHAELDRVSTNTLMATIAYQF